MQQKNQANTPKPFITPGEVYYVLFKHKWLIGILAAAGLGAAFIVKSTWPVTYRSNAKIFIRYVEESRPLTAVSEDASIRQTGGSAINTELAILTSRDLAREVAAAVGPEKILAETGGRDDLSAAAGRVAAGLTATVGRNSSVVEVQFQHPDASVVQPVLTQVIATYLKRHVEIHRSFAFFDDFLTVQTDQIRSSLTQMEEELKRLNDRAGVVSVQQTKQMYVQRMTALQQQIFDAETALAERKALLQVFGNPAASEVAASGTNSEPALPPVPEEKVDEYSRIVRLLNGLRQRELDLSLQYREVHPSVTRVRGQIAECERSKAELETEYPLLVTVAISEQNSESGFNASAERAKIEAAEVRVKVLKEKLTALREDMAIISETEPSVVELQRRKEFQEARLQNLSRSLEEARLNEALGAGRVSNITVVQEPTPPMKDVGKLQKILAGLAVGGLLGGLAFAFAWELYLNQSIRRPVEIESKLGLPLLLSIPTVAMNGRARAVKKARPPARSAKAVSSSVSEAGDGSHADASASIEPWAVNHGLRTFMEALRDRLVFYFEVRNLVHKPKLVAVTGCREGSGVSTIAAGLAATLSETGEGNVLLVDMNMGHHQPYHFYKGDLKCGLNELLEGTNRDSAQVQDHLYVVSHATGSEKLERIMPRRFNHLMPKMKASDYDYIIFDMPPISQISVTPQLSRYMDMVLMVVESEGTKQDAAKIAGGMLTEAGATVSVVLNKTRNYVPASLRDDI